LAVACRAFARLGDRYTRLMSGFENYPEELAEIDHEIVRYASICGVDIGNPHALHEVLSNHRDKWADNKARESLRGLLLLRLTLEAEMIAQGLPVKPLLPHDRSDKSAGPAGV
jgi:hypothetical protein